MSNLVSEPRNSSASGLRWFAAGSSPESLQLIDTFTIGLRKVDILLNAEEALASDVLERLSRHPRLGTLIIVGASPVLQTLIRARAAQLGLQIRFCTDEDEMRVLLNKRRSRGMIRLSDALARQQ